MTNQIANARYLFGAVACSSSVGGSKNLGVILLLPSAVLVSICLSVGPLTLGTFGGDNISKWVLFVVWATKVGGSSSEPVQ